SYRDDRLAATSPPASWSSEPLRWPTMAQASPMALPLRAWSPRARQASARRMRSQAPDSSSATRRCGSASITAPSTWAWRYCSALGRDIMAGSLRLSCLRLHRQHAQLLGEVVAGGGHLRHQRVQGDELVLVAPGDVFHARVECLAPGAHVLDLVVQAVAAQGEGAVAADVAADRIV